jgi:hypothetical protein
MHVEMTLGKYKKDQTKIGFSYNALLVKNVLLGAEFNVPLKQLIHFLFELVFELLSCFETVLCRGQNAAHLGLLFPSVACHLIAFLQQQAEVLDDASCR